MSEVRRDGYSYPNTYVESVEWQRDKAYARAEKAERERDLADRERDAYAEDSRVADEMRTEANKLRAAAEARADRLAAALRKIADRHIPTYPTDYEWMRDIANDHRRIAARALAEINNNEGGKK